MASSTATIRSKGLYAATCSCIQGSVSASSTRKAGRSRTPRNRSFRSMSAAEAENIHANRIDLYVVRQGDTWESIAERSGGVVTAQTLSIMNNSQPRDRPTPGARIKIVVGG